MSDRPLFRIHASVAIVDRDRILLVQEAKQESRGKWNLPGGHVDHGEHIPVAAMRETREETYLTLPVTGLIGIYRGNQSVRFVFQAYGAGAVAKPGDEILDVKWFDLKSIATMKDEELVSATMLRKIIDDVVHHKLYPLTMFDDRDQ